MDAPSEVEAGAIRHRLNAEHSRAIFSGTDTLRDFERDRAD